MLSEEPCPPRLDPATRDRFLSYLKTLLDSPALAPSPRRADLLRYLVEKTLAGQAGAVTEYAIGLDVFRKPDTFDPRLDSTVRSEISRMRKSLSQYYDGPGAADPWRIGFPSRGYTPVLTETAGQLEATVGLRSRIRPIHIIVASAIVLGLIVGVVFRLKSSLQPQASIVVLPFKNLSADPANQYFVEGLTDEITDLLTRNKALRVVARSSASQLIREAGDIGEMGRKLNVANVLEGSVERSGDRVKIIAHLERVSDGSHLWSNTYERRTSDLFAVQSELAASIAESLKAAAGLPAVPAHIPNAEAHDSYLRGQYELQQSTAESLTRAEADFQRAIDLDPSYAAAYYALGATKWRRANAVMNDRTDAERNAAEQSYRKALELNPEQPGPRAALAVFAMQYDWDWNRAETDLKLAVSGPPNAGADTYYASLLILHGRFSEAEVYLQRAQDLDPFGTATLMNIALARELEGRYAQARDLSQRTLSLAPAMISAKLIVALTHLEEHHPEQALPIYQELEKKFPQAQVCEAMARAAAGQREEALRLVRPFEEKGGVPMDWIARVYAFLGDEQNTLKWLNRSADAREWQALNFAVDPSYASMRNSPGFQALKKRMGL